MAGSAPRSSLQYHRLSGFDRGLARDCIHAIRAEADVRRVAVQLVRRLPFGIWRRQGVTSIHAVMIGRRYWHQARGRGWGAGTWPPPPRRTHRAGSLDVALGKVTAMLRVGSDREGPAAAGDGGGGGALVGSWDGGGDSRGGGEWPSEGSAADGAGAAFGASPSAAAPSCGPGGACRGWGRLGGRAPTAPTAPAPSRRAPRSRVASMGAACGAPRHWPSVRGGCQGCRWWRWRWRCGRPPRPRRRLGPHPLAAPTCAMRATCGRDDGEVAGWHVRDGWARDWCGAVGCVGWVTGVEVGRRRGGGRGFGGGWGVAGWDALRRAVRAVGGADAAAG